MAWHILGSRIEGQPPAWGLSMGLTTLHHKKINMIENINIRLRFGWIPWINDRIRT
jgi:hypothetical protein